MEPTAAAAPLIAPSLVQTGSERYDGSPSSLFRYLEIILHSHLSICFLLFACAGASASSPHPSPPFPLSFPSFPCWVGAEAVADAKQPRRNFFPIWSGPGLECRGVWLWILIRHKGK